MRLLKKLSLGAIAVGMATAMALAGPGSASAATPAPAPAITSHTCQALAVQLAELQSELRGAPSNQKPAIIAEIVRVEREMRTLGCSN